MGKRNYKTAFLANKGKLITERGSAWAEILDLEVDPIRCYFDGDGNIEIHTQDYNSINLSMENLTQLKKLSKQAIKYFEEYFESEDFED